MLARRSEIIINYNNKNVATAISDYIQSFDYVDNASGSADTISLKLSNKDRNWLNSWIPVEGDYLDVQIMLTNWRGQGDNRIFHCGQFMIDDLAFSGPPFVASIGGISTPIQTGFNVTKKSKTWKKTTLQGILSEVAANANVALHYEGEDYAIDELEQSNQTDMEFSFNLCKEYNLAMKIYNNKLVVFNQMVYEEKPASFVIDISDMESWSGNKSITKQYNGVSMSYTNPKNKQTLAYEFKLAEGDRILKINEKADSLQEAEIKAKAKLLEENRKCQTLSIKLKGDTKFIASQTVEIPNLGEMSGKYYINTVSHSKGADGGYYVTLALHKTIELVEEKPPEEPQSGTEYTVQQGDTLWGISAKPEHLGSGAAYMQIYNTNKEVIEAVAKAHGKSSSQNGHWIYQGTVLKIPK